MNKGGVLTDEQRKEMWLIAVFYCEGQIMEDLEELATVTLYPRDFLFPEEEVRRLDMSIRRWEECLRNLWANVNK